MKNIPEKKRHESKSPFQHPKSTLVVGDGWAAFGAVGFLALASKPVTWVTGTGARLLAPFPGLEISSDFTADGDPGSPPSLERLPGGVMAWEALVKGFGVEAGELTTGRFLREFRNKAFRHPLWEKAPTPELRREILNESVGEAERPLVPVFEARFALTLFEIEALIREKIADVPQAVHRIEGVPLQGILSSEGVVRGVRLGNGQTIESDQVIYADRWSQIRQLEGLPKGLVFQHKRAPVGVLQAEFEHEAALSPRESFFGALHREPGEDSDRHVWGYFSSDGARSVWSLCVSPEEGEDNHTLAKRLRRMKNALAKMFEGAGCFPKVKSERVRFEETILFTEGQVPDRSPRIADLKGLYFLTDGYGPTAAMKQVRSILAADMEAISAGLARSADDTATN